jgi:hypothetical protein
MEVSGDVSTHLAGNKMVRKKNAVDCTQWSETLVFVS